MYFLGILRVISRMTARLFHSRISMCPWSMVDPRRRRRDTYHRSNDRGCVAPVTRSNGGNTDHHWSLYIVSSTQSVPKIYSGAILVAYSTSSLANHAGTVVIVVAVVRRHPRVLFESEKSTHERCDWYDVVSFFWTTPSFRASATSLLSLPLLINYHLMSKFPIKDIYLFK